MPSAASLCLEMTPAPWRLSVTVCVSSAKTRPEVSVPISRIRISLAMRPLRRTNPIRWTHPRGRPKESSAESAKSLSQAFADSTPLTLEQGEGQPTSAVLDFTFESSDSSPEHRI